MFTKTPTITQRINIETFNNNQTPLSLCQSSNSTSCWPSSFHEESQKWLPSLTERRKTKTKLYKVWVNLQHQHVVGYLNSHYETEQKWLL